MNIFSVIIYIFLFNVFFNILAINPFLALVLMGLYLFFNVRKTKMQQTRQQAYQNNYNTYNHNNYYQNSNTNQSNTQQSASDLPFTVDPNNLFEAEYTETEIH